MGLTSHARRVRQPKANQRQRKERLLAMERPACWSWEVTEEAIHAAYTARTQRDAIRALELWQRGMCAICSEFVVLVVDHDHDGHEIRGLLCEPCNIREGGRGDIPVIEMYRNISPAYLLDMHVVYAGGRTTVMM